MKTKTSILAALVALAGSTSLMAQVYSLNVVGYVNLTMPPGFSLVANQLTASNNTLNAVLPSVPVESQVYTFANNNYNVDIFDGTAWQNAATGDPSTTTIQPGKGFFFFNPNTTATTVTLVGEVPLGASTVNLPPGYSLISSVVPQEISLSSANGFPQILEMLYLTFANNNYSTLINDGTAWQDAATGDPVDAKPAVGQGFFIFNPNTTSTGWSRTFNP